MEFNISNAGSMIIAKMFVDKHWDEFAKLGGKLLFKPEDLSRLLGRIKSKDAV